MKKYTFIDLFAGCGGLSEGFMSTGKFEALAHVEWEAPMVNTLRARLVDRWGHTEEEAKRRVIQFDIQKTDELIRGNWSEESRKSYGKRNDAQIIDGGMDSLIGSTKVDCIIGGPPCQAYSIAGRAQSPTGMKNDYRNYLFESFVKIVDHYKPRVFVFENVPGLLSACPGGQPVKNRIFDAFDKIGYQICSPDELKDAIRCAEDFGVPQKRNRIIIIGVPKDSQESLYDFYDAIDSKKTTKHTTVKDAICNLPKLYPMRVVQRNGRCNISHKQRSGVSVDLHIPRYHGKRDQRLIREWLSQNMNSATQEEKKAFYTKITGHTSNHIKYRNLEWDKPSPTIVAHLQKDGYMFIHPDIKQLRTITIREAALLQSFPSDYKFVGSSQYCYKMIGNAVPVLFAQNIAEGIYDVLSSNFVQRPLNVLIACEESQAVCKAFRDLGHNAYSCDLLPCSGGHPEWHFQCDVMKIIQQKGGILQNGEEAFITGEWDLMIAHPPCTYLAVSGARWYYHPDDANLPIEQRRPHPRFPNRAKDREDGASFFMSLANAPIECIAIENPIGIMSNRWRKPDQTIQPWWFGDSASKATCLWLKNLPPLEKTKVVDPGERVVLSSGKSLPKWYSDALTQAKTPEERRTLRSKTFQGIANAMADQWSRFLRKAHRKPKQTKTANKKSRKNAKIHDLRDQSSSGCTFEKENDEGSVQPRCRKDLNSVC